MRLVMLGLLLLAALARGGRDFYRTLGVRRNADKAQLKRAYRKAALKWHPDKHPENSEEANSKFAEINNAYEVLSGERARGSSGASVLRRTASPRRSLLETSCVVVTAGLILFVGPQTSGSDASTTRGARTR